MNKAQTRHAVYDDEPVTSSTGRHTAPGNQKDHGSSRHFDAISEDAVNDILGIEKAVPLSPEAMAKGLRVTFYPETNTTDRLHNFTEKLRRALEECGAIVLRYDDALADGIPGKLKEGLVVFASEELQTGNLPVDHVLNLRTTSIVGLIDGPCPADREHTSQAKLNSIVKTLAWNIVQTAIYVDEGSWTICTMNGAIIRCKYDGSFTRHVSSTLIPKLAAPVVPPHSADFEVHEGALDLSAERYAVYADDFARSGTLWARTGLMLFHTSLESLDFRNRYYKRIAAAYLDNRSGMSYGFLARQLPTPITPALTVTDADRTLGSTDWTTRGSRWFQDGLYAAVNANSKTLVAKVPDVWVLTTRSGCDKSNIDASRDIILMGLSGGRVVFQTPKGVNARVDCKPSYDTLTILSHAVGNSLVSSVLARLNPGSLFATTFKRTGMALAHWHGHIDQSVLPRGYFVHGQTNPPVSCSTHQAAIYALTGKISTLKSSLEQNIEFLGDVHVEPHHGTNMTGTSLLSLAQWLLQKIESPQETHSGIASVVEHEGDGPSFEE